MQLSCIYPSPLHHRVVCSSAKPLAVDEVTLLEMWDCYKYSELSVAPNAAHPHFPPDAEVIVAHNQKIAVRQIEGVADAVVSGTSLVVDQDVPSLRRAARVWRCRFVLRTATPTTAAPSVAVRTLLSSSCSIGTAAAPAVKLLLNCAGAVNGPIGVRGALLCLVFRSAP